MKKLIKFLISDAKRDLETFKAILQGNAQLKPGIREELQQTTITGYIIENWGWIIAILMAFCSGWLLTGAYYSHQANEAILRVVAECNNFLAPTVTEGINWTFNMA